jgi:mono/diheme cytochrome c family protein
MRTEAYALIGIAALLLVASAPALAAGDADAGKVFAERSCSSCHLVTTDQKSATTEAPPFTELAQRPHEQIEALATFLTAPHPPMPPVSLTRREIENVVAYIESLKEVQ